jgi:uncharacterized protein (TIGR02453 family)
VAAGARHKLSGVAFQGFPAQAFGFYERLAADNSRNFWAAHKSDYEVFVREPVRALAGELEDEFGQAVVFRPSRDTRFSADKSPYKTYQGAFVERFAGTGFYVQVSADGVEASGGFHSHAADQVERYRLAVESARPGAALAAILAGLRDAGLSIGGDRLKTRPRGVPADHPRVDLLRHRSLTAGRDWPAGPVLHTREALSMVRQTWRQLKPLCDWFGEHVGPSEQ